MVTMVNLCYAYFTQLFFLKKDLCTKLPISLFLKIIKLFHAGYPAIVIAILWCFLGKVYDINLSEKKKPECEALYTMLPSAISLNIE